MDVSGFWPIFGIACAGGAVIELFKWWQLRESANWPAYVSSPGYWVLTLLMIGAGGFLAVLYGTEEKQALLVLNVGISAPAIIRALAANVPEPIRRGKAGAPASSVRNFLAVR